MNNTPDHSSARSDAGILIASSRGTPLPPPHGGTARTGAADNLSVHFSSKSDEWATPQDFFDKLNAEFGFTLDAAATAENAKCARFYTAEDDSLSQPWVGIVWCNPPYSRGLQAKFVRKAYESAKAGATVVMLIPARTDTAVWHDYIFKYATVRFVRGRLKFGGCKNSAPFPSAVAIFRPPTPSRIPHSQVNDQAGRGE